jgi:hypothetical protein
MWYLLHKFYSESELGVAYTIIATASSLSGLAGGPLAAELLDLDGTLHMHGWQVKGTAHIVNIYSQRMGSRELDTHTAGTG